MPALPSPVARHASHGRPGRDGVRGGAAARRPGRGRTRTALGLLAGGTVFAVAATALVDVARADLPATSAPVLTLGTTVPTTPFTGSATSAKDVDGAAYVPADDALWVVDSKARAVYEVDATTKALRRTVPTSAFLAATDVTGSGTADATRVDAFSAAAYDPAADALYVFSGNAGGNPAAVPPVQNNPTVFRLTRDGAGRLQPTTWRDLPDGTSSDMDGAAVRPGSGLLWTARGTKVRTVDYATGTIANVATVTGITSIRGLSFSDDGTNAYLVGDGTTFLRTATTGATWAALPGWTVDLGPLGVVDARSADVVGNRLYVADGADTRVAGDPLRWALFGIDVAAAAAAPVASFTASATSGTAPLAVSFNDTSTNGPTSWAWTFGDGGTSTLAAPSHTFTAAGTYTVTLTATNGSGSGSASRTVTVTSGAAAPVARFRGAASGATVTFTDESAGSPTSRTWDFGDGTSSTATNPAHTYTADGVYSVSLTVSNAGGPNTRVRSSYVTVTGGVATVLARTALPDVEGPGLRLSRTIAAAPFRGTSTSMRDDEGSAYVPADGSLWLTDDAGAKLFEVDAVTGALKRTVATADLANALPVGGGAAAGASRTDDLGSAAYDPVADALYVFSGNCCAATGLDPTAFRLTRDGTGAFQVDSYRALPDGTDPTGAAYRAGVGITLVRGQKVTPYDYATNTLGSAQSIAGTDVAISGAAFTTDGAELLAVSSGKRFYRASMATNAVRQGWTVDLTPFGILDPRAVELVDGQLYVSDGADTRDAADPLRYAVFVFDVVDATAAPTADFTFTPPSGGAPHEVQFTDASTGAPKSWLWEFGDGKTSKLQSPAHAFSDPGTYSVKLTVANAKGTNSKTVAGAVTVAPNSPLLAARFTASVTAGPAPLAVQFTDDSTGPVTGRVWDFGDGSSSTAANPLKTYPVTGTYTVRLTVTTADGRTNTRVRTDYVRVGGGSVTFGTAADTWVRSDTVTATNGTAKTMRGKGGTTTYQPYLRFSVAGLAQTPTRATLRLFTTDASTGSGTLYRTADATWSESTLSWSTAPATTGGPVAASAPAALGSWVELDVTSVVTGDGEYSFTLANPPADAVAFSSKESSTAAQRPQLVVSFGGPPPAPSLVLPSTPSLRLNRFFTTSPFSGTTVSARDQEGAAYVPQDDALWVSDDNTGRVYEIDARTSLLRRVVTQEELVTALPIGGGTEPAGAARADDLEAMAYDADADELYLLAGNCCGTAPFKPTAYRFTRDAAGDFQLEGYKPLPEGTDNTGLAWRRGQGLVGVHSDHVIPYDFATNTVGAELTLAPFNNQQFVGLDFTDDGKYAFVTTKGQRLYMFDAATWTLVPGWDFDLAPYGLLDPRWVEIVDGQLWVGDGYDFRDPSDPMEYATFVFDLVGPSKASFTATPTAGTAPLPVTFTDTTLGDVTARSWDFGDGTTSTLATVTKTYAAPGTYTVSLTVTTPSGASTETRTGLVVVGTAPSEVVAAADTYARSDKVTTNYGTAAAVSGRVLTAGNLYQPYLRFTVPALGRPVTKATLRLYVTDASDATGPVFRTVDGAWSESALTWNTRPAQTGTAVAPSQKAVVGQWVEFDVTSVVTGAGDYGFVLPATSTNAVGFASKEPGAATAPRIAFTLG